MRNNKSIKLIICAFISFIISSMTVAASEIAETDTSSLAGDFVFWAESEEEALEIAAMYEAVLISYENGIGTLMIPVAEETPMLFTGRPMEEDDECQTLPELYPNLEYVVESELEDGTRDGTVTQWHMDYLEMKEAWEYATGSDVKVAIVDSGIDTTHEALVANIDKAVSVVPETSYGGAGFPLNYSGPGDYLGHGTHVAGIIAANTEDGTVMGMAPDCRIYSYKALERSGNSATGYTSWIANAIISAVEDGADIINLSIGGNKSEDKFISKAIDIAVEQGCFVVCAAGNYNGSGKQSEISYPALDEDTIAVTAAKMKGDGVTIDLSYSKYGEGVTFIAPGTRIYSTDKENTYGYKSGTSMATPMVSAAAALIKEMKPEADIQEILQMLTDTALDLGEEGLDIYNGYGMIQPLQALKSIAEDEEPGDEPGNEPGDDPEDEPKEPEDDKKPNGSGNNNQPDVPDRPEINQKPIENPGVAPKPELPSMPDDESKEEEDDAENVEEEPADQKINDSDIGELREEMENIPEEEQNEYTTQQQEPEPLLDWVHYILLFVIIMGIIVGKILLKKK